MLRLLGFMGIALIGGPVFGQPMVPSTPSVLPMVDPALASQIQPGNQSQPAQPTETRHMANRVILDKERESLSRRSRYFAACLTLGYEEEVALGQFAAAHAQSDQIKQFAGRLVEDDKQSISQLRRFVPDGVSLQLSQPGEKANDRTSKRADDRSDDASDEMDSQTSDSGDGGNQNQMLAIEREVKQQCLLLTQEELQKHRGDDFDRAYLGQQLVRHLQIVAELRTFERNDSPELQPVFSDQRQNAEEHLIQVRELKQELGTNAK